MAWTFGKRLAIGFALAALVTIILSVVAYRNVTSSVEQAAWVAHTNEVLADAEALGRHHEAIVSASRGYTITGEDRFADRMREQIAKAEAALQRLVELTHDNPSQQTRLERVRDAAGEHISARRKQAELRRTGGFEGALTMVKSGEALVPSQRMEQALGELTTEEKRLLAARSAEANDSAAATKSTLLYGTILAAIMVAIIGTIISRSLTREIGTANLNLQSSSTELHAAANQQVNSSKDQASALIELATTMRELLSTSRQITDSAQRVSRIAEDTSSGAKAGGRAIEKGQQEIVQIQKQVDVMTAHVIDLGKKSQQIGDILGIINELSEQTNILAINATIESAGAGEAGKRFAVVANEIRKLADRVSGSTRDIAALIEVVRSAANSTVMAAESGTKAVESGARQFAELVATFNQIREGVVTTTDAAKEIELSTKQQASAVEQVNSAISSITQSAQETEVSSRQTLQTAAQLSTLAKDLSRIIQPRATNGVA